MAGLILRIFAWVTSFFTAINETKEAIQKTVGDNQTAVIIATIAGIIADPGGFCSSACCFLVDLFTGFIPDMPPEYSIGAIANLLGDNIPFIGSGIFYKVIRDISAITALVIPIKIYKLLPFKFT